VRAQNRLHEIQGNRGLWYCGAWTNYGFHEDGFSSGVAVGRMLGGSVPWEVVDAKFVRGRKPSFTWKDYVLRFYLVIIQLMLDLVSGVLSTYFKAKEGKRVKKM
jgi:hypothetical protein